MCAAHFSDGVVEGSAAVAAFPDVPAEDLFAEVRRASNVGGRHLDIADLAVQKGGRHGRPVEAVPF
jgi:hypothetical protein